MVKIISFVSLLQSIPDNVFIIAACNPHRGNSLAMSEATVSTPENWFKPDYYVQKLHPTLRHLIWDYGALSKEQEKEYITAKLKFYTSAELPETNVNALSDLVSLSQKILRQYASQHMENVLKLSPMEAKLCAKSCVSQRDIQRVFIFYSWIMKIYKKYDPHKEDENQCVRRAILVALGLVYYMRLNVKCRRSYKQFLDKIEKLSEYDISFSKAFDDEINWFTKQLILPNCIAETVALKENMFATIACTMTRTPLIIVGNPGTSKTLSFNIVTANLKGKESKVELFRDKDIFMSLDPHFYQCSRRTTSTEIEKVFSRAIVRQSYLAKVPLPVYSVVFMDEAGLPIQRMDSLKALHYHLDEQTVSFVAISNDVLDAAKTNRAVSLFRPQASEKELQELALASIGDEVPTKSKEVVEALASAYLRIQNSNISDFRCPFGLRDFISFVTYLRRKTKDAGRLLSLQTIVNGLERNFNGIEFKHFQQLCATFMRHVSCQVYWLAFSYFYGLCSACHQQLRSIPLTTEVPCLY